MIFGFTIGDWVGIFTIIGMASGAIYKCAVSPLLKRFDRLSNTIAQLDDNSQKERKRLHDEIDAHHSLLAVHDAELQALYNDKKWPRKNWTTRSEKGEV